MTKSRTCGMGHDSGLDRVIIGILNADLGVVPRRKLSRWKPVRAGTPSGSGPLHGLLPSVAERAKFELTPL